MSKDEYLAHYGITGQKWGVRNYENYDGTLTPEGRERYSDDNERAEREKADTKERQNMCDWGHDQLAYEWVDSRGDRAAREIYSRAEKVAEADERNFDDVNGLDIRRCLDSTELKEFDAYIKANKSKYPTAAEYDETLKKQREDYDKTNKALKIGAGVLGGLAIGGTLAIAGAMRSNAAHSEFNEKDEYLAHYGVDGMRWGVWNEETAHRYGMGNSSSPSQRPRSEKYDFKEVDGSDKKFKMDKDSGIHMKAGSQISRMQSSAGERKGEAFYAITKQDADKYRAVNKAQALATKAGGKSWWGGQYQSNSILKTDLWAPSRETTKTALGEVLKDKNNREAFKNAMTAQKEMERLGIKGHQSKLDKFIVGAKVDKAALTGKADDRLIQRLSNVSGYTMNERIKAANEAAGLGNISVRDELWKNLSKQGYNAIIDYNDKDTGFHTNTPIIVFNRQAAAHVKLGEDVLAKNGINP